MFKTSFLLCLALLCLVNAAGAASNCHDLFKSSPEAQHEAPPKTRDQEHPFRKFKSELAGEPRVTLSRFNGLDSFHQSRSSQFTASPDGFSVTEKGLDSTQVGFDDHETYLDELQKFPLGKMAETGYLTKAEAKMFQSLGTSLNTGQINFLEMTRVATRTEMEHYPPELLASRIARSPFSYQDGLTSIRTATLWSVSGQLTENGSQAHRTVPLPWEKEDARKSQALDRKRYPYVWEWGRAAQDIPEEISALYSANAALNYADLMAHGGRLEDAYVMFHSFDKVNTRLYLSDHPGSTYPADWKDPNDSLFIVPLAEMLRRYPPSKFSANVARIIKASQGKIGEIDALDLLLQNRLARWEELDSTGTVKQKSPIILADISRGYILNLLILLGRHHLTPQETDQIMRTLVRIEPTLYTANVDQKYKNAADAVVTGHTYKAQNAVEISNLDPELAARDPNYVVSIIFQSYISYVHKLSYALQSVHGYTKLDANNEAIRLMVEHQIKFGVTTASPEIDKQCQRLNPSATFFQAGTQGKPDRDILASHPYWFNAGHISLFTMPQILSWARANPQFFMKDDYVLNPGYWRTQSFLSQIDLL